MRVGLPGLVLLVCTFFLIHYRLDLQPLLGTPPNPETPNLSVSEIRSHLVLLGALALLTASGTVLSFALAAFLGQFSSGAARLLQLAGWPIRLTVLGLLVFALGTYGQTLVQRGLTTGGERSFLLGVLTAALGLPATILTWMAMNRLGRWIGLALTWDGRRPGALQHAYRRLNGSWRLLTALLLGLAAWALPLTLIDLPHSKAQTVSTLLDKAVISQQHPLFTLAMLSALSAGLCAWFAGRALAERTAALDGTSSRISGYLSRSGAAS